MIPIPGVPLPKIPLPGLSTGGGALDLGSNAESGDAYSTTNSSQGGLTVNKGIPTWLVGAGFVGVLTVSAIYLLGRK
jgi:hypothetical protein